MWDLYVESGRGIGIRSTADRLIQSLHWPFIDEKNTLGIEDGPTAAFFAGGVRYVNYDADIVASTGLDYLTLKRKSFEHEREFRAVMFSARPLAGGQLVQCNLGRLIDQIYVSPASPAWFRDAVQAVVDRYGIDREVR